tara:strand:- start:400 stop:630 length:231 start_codon:yes stop_codon:yes gene_type:complete
MKVRIQETIEFYKHEVRVLKKMAEENGYSSWRDFVSWKICSLGHGDLDAEIYNRLEQEEWQNMTEEERENNWVAPV